jgi:hypothetical protein
MILSGAAPAICLVVTSELSIMSKAFHGRSFDTSGVVEELLVEIHLQLSVFLVYLKSNRSRNRDGRRAMTRSGGLRSDESYGSGNVKPHVHIISSFIRYRRSASESKMNPPMGKVLTLPTSTRGCTKMSRTPGQSEGFGIGDGAYYLGCRGSMKSFLRRRPLMVLFLFQRTPQVGNGSHDAGEAPTRRIFGSASPVASNTSQGPSPDVDSARLENGDAERSPSASNSPRPRAGTRVLRPTTGQVLQPSKRKPSQKNRQTQPVANISLGPVHSSKVSKVAGKKKPGPQRRSNSQKVSFDGLLLSSGVDAAEPQPSPDRITPRRSKRIQPPVPSVAKDLARTASTNPTKRAVRSKAKRNVASNLSTRSSAKPRGISKRQSPKTTLGKAREI